MAELKSIAVGFLGCGNVGSGVYRLLDETAEQIAHRCHLKFEVRKILVRSLNKKRNVNAPSEVFTTDPADIVENPEIDMVLEFLGGEQPATDYMLRALNQGKTVITANKVALAMNWHLLQKAAEDHGCGLYYEASVGGAIPVIQTLGTALTANRIDELMAIINGTTNYILSRMTSDGEDYDTVLAEAQRLGLAEPDPSSDVEGMDAACKLSIMASLAFHGRVTYAQVYREGITGVSAVDIAMGRELGLVLKPLAIAKRENDTVEIRVHPTFLPRSHPLASVNGSFNAVYLRGSACREMMLQGRGAGDMPTASAIVGDLLHAAMVTEHLHPTFRNTAEPDASLAFTDNWKTRYYIRLSAADSIGVLARVAEGFARCNVSIASMVQKDADAEGRVPLILVTHLAPEHALRTAVSGLDPEICRVESVIRVEQ